MNKEAGLNIYLKVATDALKTLADIYAEVEKVYYDIEEKSRLE